MTEKNAPGRGEVTVPAAGRIFRQFGLKETAAWIRLRTVEAARQAKALADLRMAEMIAAIP